MSSKPFKTYLKSIKTALNIHYVPAFRPYKIENGSRVSRSDWLLRILLVLQWVALDFAVFASDFDF